MSFDSVPPKVEVMGWNARSLADYMKRLKLSGCDKVVIKRSITGAQFMDKEGDDDGGEYKDEENSYVCALSESPQPGQTESEEANAMSDYEPLASPDTKEQPLHPGLPKPLGDGPHDLPCTTNGVHKQRLTKQATSIKGTYRAGQLQQGMDPRWYAGQVTRHQGEVVLKQVNKDGAFVVRDSSKGLSEQPYTLMVLSQGKVYNIQIRNQGNSYSLGSGHWKTESFPGVKEIISHHTRIPLLLIDATDYSAGAKSQCCLLHPAGF
ncbi:lymphocyte cytosolic protein 2 [Myripristis murdjan]|uniref:lymphocyte cytosolic protein 2 n=1 Tax=Myripristis murdjan TaxID=586833 RepID=UPI001175D777|nr:lymphocyte cytosolic protein 2-like [Myripristis murdjan]